MRTSSWGPGQRQDWVGVESRRPSRWIRLLGGVAGGLVTLFVLAVFAFPACGCSNREPSYFSAMKSDLKNLASQQEIYFSDHQAYSTNASDVSFTSSQGVIVRIMLDGGGWTAATRHVALEPDRGCALYIEGVTWPMRTPGGRLPEGPGEIVCDP